MSKFNGHKNWNFWNVSLWINNDEGLYRLALDCIKRAGGKDGGAVLFLGYCPATTPDGAPYSKSAVRAAMVGM